jgi:hypothetical protein
LKTHPLCCLGVNKGREGEGSGERDGTGREVMGWCWDLVTTFIPLRCI